MQINTVDRSPNWRPSGAYLQSAVASRPTPEVAPNTTSKVAVAAATAASSLDTSAVDGTSKPAPGAASLSMETSDYGVTIKQPTVEKPQVPPVKPVYIKLIENLQAMWRASGNAVEVVAEASKTANPVTLVQGPLVYPDPKVKKVSNH